MARQRQRINSLNAGDLLVVLRLQSARGIGSGALGRIIDDCMERGVTPAEIGSIGAEELEIRYRLSPESARAFQINEDALKVHLKELNDRSVQVLVRGWPGYPRRLLVTRGSDAPPVLFAIGNLSLFERPAVGFCGSRKASERGIAIAKECARFLASTGSNARSGYPHGVDLSAHPACLESARTTSI